MGISSQVVDDGETNDGSRGIIVVVSIIVA
jgi:hypothetical protein